MTTFTTSLDGVTAQHLDGFFVGWPSPPSADRLLQVLRGSSHVVFAWQGERVVGFINALSDGVLSAFVPLLEVRPQHQGQGIGHHLVERMLTELGDLYSVDLVCDPALAPFYESVGGQLLTGVAWRNRAALSGLLPTIGPAEGEELERQGSTTD